MLSIANVALNGKKQQQKNHRLIDHAKFWVLSICV